MDTRHPETPCRQALLARHVHNTVLPKEMRAQLHSRLNSHDDLTARLPGPRSSTRWRDTLSRAPIAATDAVEGTGAAQVEVVSEDPAGETASRGNRP